MGNSARAVFDDFIVEARKVWGPEAPMGERVSQILPLMQGLVGHPAIREAVKAWPSTEGLGNLLLYTDPDFDFVVNAVVRDPGRKGGVHDHADAWVLYGLVEGTETLERWRRLDDGSVPGYAKVELESASRGLPGHVDVVSPNDIHAELGGPDRSVAIIFRSVRLVGRVLQNGYDPVTNKVVQRSGPKQVPFEIAA